ncbi:PPOX class F420-dependent oxidoreductase [Rubrobacter tropicus]|uniref:PPOX class F420-dependent oxidoreductase n=1 Tax=Rubrobacter tropicus TaxID=2653851 RepID=A0A6G8Q484_9ACTN|nr:PPOX class F420-dependent oxidoreductase [Rubrobacter tropicus]QIN81258.1 PPOX class F420-dependent oxidoreductase [Rubrobacter tropicus]
MRKTIKTPFEARAASARGATALGSASLGAAAVGAGAFGAVAIGALAIRRLAIRRGKIGHLSIEDLEVGRLRVRELVVEEQRSAPRPFEVLDGHRYVNLTTFRRGGEAVTTTIWFVRVGDNIYATTPPDSGKMKRIRNDPRVVLAPSNARGRTLGAGVGGKARVIDGAAPEGAETALREKYGLGLTLFRIFGPRNVGQVTLEVSPVETEGA